MLGAIIGDIIGAPYEFCNYRGEDFELFTSKSDFTDDTVMTAATALAILTDRNYAKHYHSFGNNYPGRGYGTMFSGWLRNPSAVDPYGSFGNGSAMRVSPIAFFCKNIEQVREEALKSANATHNHELGVKGAVCVAESIFMLKTGVSDEELFRYIERNFYKVNTDFKKVRRENIFDETCEKTVPVAFTAFFESHGFEDCIRKAISLGGDSDTIAAIAGGLAEAKFGIPAELKTAAIKFITPELSALTERFYSIVGSSDEKPLIGA